MGDCHRLQNQPLRAAAAYRQALAIDPELAAARGHLESILGSRQMSRTAAVFSDLQASEKRVYSQNGEDGVIEALFAELGTTNKYYVEFGSGGGDECNTAWLREQGWTGLLMDGMGDSHQRRNDVRQEFITAENINDLFRKYGVPGQYDLLSIDIDGNDFWVWRQIEARARVVVIEYNAFIPPNERRTVVYDPHLVFQRTDYFGASLLALKELGQHKGYTLVYCERTGVNAFFVANEALPADFEPLAFEEIYRIPNYAGQGWRFPRETSRTMVDPFLP